MLQKMENYKSALSRLEEAVERYQRSPEDSLYRDGLIQRFEFTVELAWKSLKEYLADQGVCLSIASPRGILKEAFAIGVLEDGELWNEILTARNLTSHIYNEATATEIAWHICVQFLPPLQALLKIYES
ncbi:MAG: nucleotidyltransferase substrate binding protein [Oscillospiraceae bacterium]|nr:nucleotidyltransferase substrate binding protein [Oscillospiraceae bacterium]